MLHSIKCAQNMHPVRWLVWPQEAAGVSCLEVRFHNDFYYYYCCKSSTLSISFTLTGAHCSACIWQPANERGSSTQLSFLPKCI